MKPTIQQKIPIHVTRKANHEEAGLCPASISLYLSSIFLTKYNFKLLKAKLKSDHFAYFGPIIPQTIFFNSIPKTKIPNETCKVKSSS